MIIEIDDDFADDIVRKQLESELDFFTSLDTSESSVFYWKEPKKEAKEVQKMIKALRKVLSWYH